MGDLVHSLFPFLDAKGFCVEKTIKFDLINTDLAGQFNLQLNSSIMIGLILGVPYLLYEIWKFIKWHCLTRRKAASGFVFYSSSLFMLGVLFGYYVITPLSIRFFASYTVSSAIKNIFAIDSFISSETMLTLLAGLVFQLPIVVYILSSLGILTPKFMRDKRRYAVIIVLILAAIITPSPDALTMLIVAKGFSAVGITVSAVVQRRKKKQEEEEMNS